MTVDKDKLTLKFIRKAQPRIARTNNLKDNKVERIPLT